MWSLQSDCTVFVFGPFDWVQHPGTVRHHHVRRDQPYHVQKRSQLAPGPYTSVRAHPDRALREQGMTHLCSFVRLSTWSTGQVLYGIFY